ncbi:MAG: M23 family metallopeptidase [Actinomycetota bacterium]|nr:M23 family metallopeptidase [Actinomycetota bacterium]
MLWPAAEAAAANPGGATAGVCPDLAVPPGSWIRPTDGVLTSEYGTRDGSLHAGVDIAGPRDTPVYAAASGTVTRAECSSSYCDRDGNMSVPGYGNVVDIDHGAAQSTRYGHLSSYTVSAGQVVSAGALIGYQGATGHVTGVHLHFETSVNGTAVDPIPFMAERGVDLYVETAG